MSNPNTPEAIAILLLYTNTRVVGLAFSSELCMVLMWSEREALWMGGPLGTSVEIIL